jgi:hypothetical protein
MLLSFAVSGTENFSSFLFNHYLNLAGVFFLLPVVKVFLFFLGRSMGVSVTSTTMTSIWRSPLGVLLLTRNRKNF